MGTIDWSAILGFPARIVTGIWHGVLGLWDFFRGNLPFAALIGVMAALLKEELTRLWRHPQLTAKVAVTSPFCVKTPLRVVRGNQAHDFGCYYYRIWIENSGNQRAERVQVYAAELFHQSSSGKYVSVQSFLPLNLKWANSIDGKPVVYEDLSPGIGRHCDIGHVNSPEYGLQTGDHRAGVPVATVLLRLDTEVDPFTRSSTLMPGNYRLRLRIAAANVRPAEMLLELRHSGDWFEDEATMFSHRGTSVVGVRKLGRRRLTEADVNSEEQESKT